MWIRNPECSDKLGFLLCNIFREGFIQIFDLSFGVSIVSENDKQAIAAAVSRQGQDNQ